MLTTIIVFILILGLLIFVHEFGHFIMAKRAGAKVEEFGFGFPPRIFGIKRGETIYSLNLIPLGGFVKILGESGEEKKNPRSFASKTIGQRAKMLSAGVIMNIILAAVLLSFGFAIGLPTVLDGIDEKVNLRQVQIQIAEVATDSPAEQAGLKMGDAILSVNGQPVEEIDQLQGLVNAQLGKEISLEISRGKERLTKQIIARQNPPAEEGAMGVALVKTALVSYPWYKSLWLGIVTTFSLLVTFIVAIFKLLWNLITTGQLMVDISGPVGIAVLTNQVTKLGFIYILQFTALLSINLAIINALPFPALDGGRLLFLLIEKIKGSPVSQKVEKGFHTAGFLLLIILMIAITWRDITRWLIK